MMGVYSRISKMVDELEGNTYNSFLTGYVNPLQTVSITSSSDPNLEIVLDSTILNSYLNDNIKIPEVDRIIYNDPVTIVFWKDGTKTKVRCAKDAVFDKYNGFLAALGIKIYGNNSKLQKMIKALEFDQKEYDKKRKEKKKEKKKKKEEEVQADE